MDERQTGGYDAIDPQSKQVLLRFGELGGPAGPERQELFLSRVSGQLTHLSKQDRIHTSTELRNLRVGSLRYQGV